MTTELEAAVAELQRDVERGEYSGGGYRYIEADPEALRKVLAHLSSPPADDVRERSEEVAARVYPEQHHIHMKHAYADAFERGYREAEVRLRGTVTEAEVERALDALAKDYVILTADRMRAALEAARGARVSAENITPTNHTDGGL